MTRETHPTVSASILVNQESATADPEDFVFDNLSSQDICRMFNEFLLQFERMETSEDTTTSVFLAAVENMVNAALSIAPSKLLDSRVLHHPLMQFFQQMLTDLLKNWQASHLRLNIQETDIFLKIVLIFVHASEAAAQSGADENRKIISDLLATKSFLFLVNEQIIDNIRYKAGINDDPNICTLGLLTMKLLQGSPFFDRSEQNQCLIDDLIINCIDSYDYIQSLRQLQHGEPLTEMDRFLLFTCWEYIPFVSTNARSPAKKTLFIDSIQHIYDELLTRLENALDESPDMAPSVLSYILERYSQLINTHNLPSFDKHANYIVLYLSNILQSSSTTNNHHYAFIALALGAFYNLVNNSDIRSIIRKHHLTSLFNKYTSTHIEQETRQIALGILAQTMDEQEINKNPAEITANFVNQLKQLHPNTYNPHLDSVLSSLRVLMQHEQIKNEFVKQGGLHLLIAFVRDGDPDKQYPQQLEDALAILWSCTFNNPQALKMLQQDTQLMVRINQLVDNAKHHGNSSLEKAAEGVIWKVEKEEKFEQQLQEKERKARATAGEEEGEGEEEEEEQYDCMVSYSWADMDLAHRIFRHLTDKLGYKVWLDQEQMHGSTIETMANAVENAQFILMCMSETYKRSANCQSEAEYAFKRKKFIIPIVMKEGYTADGWLGFILGTRMYIDFGTYDFEKASGLLQNEIQLQKKKRKEVKDLAKTERRIAKANENRIDMEDELSNGHRVGEKENALNTVVNWKQRNVRKFLLTNNLSSMVPVCDGMNGEELFTLYAMCKTNSASMYRSLKFELLHGHHRILPIFTFLHFISSMRAVCNDGLPFNTQTVKKICGNHLPNNE